MNDILFYLRHRTCSAFSIHKAYARSPAAFVLVQGLLLIKVPTAYYDTIKIDYVLLALFLLNAAVYAINVHHAFKKQRCFFFYLLLSLTELSEPSF